MLNPRMLMCVSLLTGASIAAPAAAKTVAKAPKDGAGCLEVVPGKGLGPFQGMPEGLRYPITHRGLPFSSSYTAT